MLFLIDGMLFPHQESIGLRLEDLKERSKEAMGALCNSMGI